MPSKHPSDHPSALLRPTPTWPAGSPLPFSRLSSLFPFPNCFELFFLGSIPSVNVTVLKSHMSPIFCPCQLKTDDRKRTINHSFPTAHHPPTTTHSQVVPGCFYFGTTHLLVLKSLTLINLVHNGNHIGSQRSPPTTSG